MRFAIALLLLVILPGMRFDSLTPTSGKEGDVLTITGDNFGSDCEVTLGRKVVKIDSISSTEVKIKAPRHSVGKKSLVMTCKDRMPIFEREVFTYTQ